MSANNRGKRSCAEIAKDIAGSDFTLEEFKKIKRALKSKMEPLKKDEQEVLVTWVLNEWDNCERVRNKASNEGLDYFYHHYTHVPVKYDLYHEFITDDECWCEHCGGSDEAEEDESE